MDIANLTSEFEKKGYVVVRKLLNDNEVASYRSRLETMAEDHADSWTVPDGVSKTPEFWPVIFNETLVTIVRQLLGPDISYLQHNDLHVGFSSPAWHRDSVNRMSGVGSDWDEAVEPYRVVRCGMYLQDFTESQFKLGLIPGSHRPDLHLSKSQSRRVERTLKPLASVFSMISRKDLLANDAEWIATNPGDCVIFDPRVVHTGSRIRGDKYSMFVAYGKPNRHFHNHWNYYRETRFDLGYEPLADELVGQLKKARLYTERKVADSKTLAAAQAGVYKPSKAYVFLAKRFK